MRKFKQFPLGKQLALLLVLALVSAIIPAYIFGWGSSGSEDYFTVTFSVQGEGGSIVTYVFAPETVAPAPSLPDIGESLPGAPVLPEEDEPAETEPDIPEYPQDDEIIPDEPGAPEEDGELPDAPVVTTSAAFSVDVVAVEEVVEEPEALLLVEECEIADYDSEYMFELPYVGMPGDWVTGNTVEYGMEMQETAPPVYDGWDSATESTPGEVVTVVGDDSLQVRYGSVVRITAVPDDGFVVDGWGVLDGDGYRFYYEGLDRVEFEFVVVADSELFVRFGAMYAATLIPIISTDFTTTPMVATSTSHSVALTHAGTVYTWGNNYAGQLGDGTRGYRTRTYPKRVPGLYNIVYIAAGSSHTLAVCHHGHVYTWGGWFTNLPYHYLSPVRMRSLYNIVSVATETSYSMALDSSGNVYTWSSSRLAPPQITRIFEGAKKIAAGDTHFVVLAQNGDVYSWGSNLSGQLGLGSTNVHYYTPQRLELPVRTVAIAAGRNHTVVVGENDIIRAWGSNNHGQILNPPSNTPFRSPQVIWPLPHGLHGRQMKVYAGGDVTAIFRQELTTISAPSRGNNTYGVVDGFHSSIWNNWSSRPGIDIMDFSISIGYSHAVGITGDGYVVTWGSGYGTGVVGNSNTPVHMPGVDGTGYFNLSTYVSTDPPINPPQSPPPYQHLLRPANYYRWTLNRHGYDTTPIRRDGFYQDREIIHNAPTGTRILVEYYLYNTHGNRWYRASYIPGLGHGTFWIYSGNLSATPIHDIRNFLSTWTQSRIFIDSEFLSVSQTYTPVSERVEGRITNITSYNSRQIDINIVLPDRVEVIGGIARVQLYGVLDDNVTTIERQVAVMQNSDGTSAVNLVFESIPASATLRWEFDVMIRPLASNPQTIGYIRTTITSEQLTPEVRDTAVMFRPQEPFALYERGRYWYYTGVPLTRLNTRDPIPGDLNIEQNMVIPAGVTLNVTGDVRVTRSNHAPRGTRNTLSLLGDGRLVARSLYIERTGLLDMQGGGRVELRNNFSFASDRNHSGLLTRGTIQVGGDTNITTSNFVASGENSFEIVARASSRNIINTTSRNAQFNRLVLPSYSSIDIPNAFRANQVTLGRSGRTPTPMSELRIETRYSINFLGFVVPDRREIPTIQNRINKAFAMLSSNVDTGNMFQSYFENYGMELSMSVLNRDGTGQIELYEVVNQRVVRYRVTFSNIFSFNGAMPLGQGTYQMIYPSVGTRYAFSITNTSQRTMDSAVNNFRRQMDDIARKQFENVTKEMLKLGFKLFDTALANLLDVPTIPTRGDMIFRGENADAVILLLQRNRDLVTEGLAQHIVQRFNCPVDIFVYNNGRLVGSIINYQTQFHDDYANILLWVDGETKIVSLYGENAMMYEVASVAREDGVMSVSISHYDGDGVEHTRHIFERISLARGDRFISVYANNTIVKNGTATAYSPTQTMTSDRMMKVSIDVPPPARGYVTGYGSHVIGDAVSLFASARYGYKFAGWYENGALVSNSENYGFMALNNRVLEARFATIGTTQPPDEDDEVTPSPPSGNATNPQTPPATSNQPPPTHLTTPPPQGEHPHTPQLPLTQRHPATTTQPQTSPDTTTPSNEYHHDSTPPSHDPYETPLPTPPPTNNLTFTANQPQYQLNGATRTAVGTPFIDRATNRMMVPLRTISYALGVTAEWCSATRAALLHFGTGTLSVPAGEMLPNGMGTVMVVNDRIFVPLRFVMYNFNAEVEWDSANRAAIISW